MRAKDDPSIILMTGDLGYSVVEEFRDTLPSQFLNMGITEQSTISFAAGLAKNGFKPFVYSIGNFPTFRCLEQIRNDVCYMNSNVTIVAVGAGFAYGTAGYSHHLVEDISAMSALSNLEIYSPYDPDDVATCLQGILLSGKPSYLRIGRGGDQKIEVDIRLEGELQPSKEKTASIIFTGSIGKEAVEAARILKSSGVKVETISVSDFSKVETVRLQEVLDGKPFLILEEHVLRGGFGSLILEVLSEEPEGFSCRRLGIPEIDPNLSGSTAYLRAEYKIDANSITKAMTALLDLSHE
jgi:transketolase